MQREASEDFKKQEDLLKETLKKIDIVNLHCVNTREKSTNNNQKRNDRSNAKRICDL